MVLRGFLAPLGLSWEGRCSKFITKDNTKGELSTMEIDFKCLGPKKGVYNFIAISPTNCICVLHFLDKCRGLILRFKIS